jgi:hypothetical protein
MKTTRVPEDSVLRRHYMQMQEAGLIPAAENEPAEAPPAPAAPTPAPAAPTPAAPTPAPAQKGFLSRLLDKLFGK